MTNVELETLVVRLEGDVSQYMQMMKQAQAGTEDTARKVEAAALKIEGFTKHIEGFAGAVEGTLAKIGIAMGAWSAFEKFDRAQERMRHLSAAIENNGKDVNSTISEYKAFAEEINKTTMTGRGATMGLLKQAEAYDMSSAKAKEAVKNAILLAAATDKDAESTLMFTAALAKGDMATAMRYKRQIRELRSATTETELLTKATKLYSLGEKVAAGDIDDATGKLEKLKEAMGKVTKEIGEMLSKVIDPLIDELKDVTDAFNKLDPTLRKIIIGSLAFIALSVPFIAAVKYIVGAFNLWRAAIIGLYTTQLPGLVTQVGALATAQRGLAAAQVAVGAAMTSGNAAAIAAAEAGIIKQQGLVAAQASYVQLLKVGGLIAAAYFGYKLVGWITGATKATDELTAAEERRSKLGKETGETLTHNFALQMDFLKEDEAAIEKKIASERIEVDSNNRTIANYEKSLAGISAVQRALENAKQNAREALGMDDKPTDRTRRLTEYNAAKESIGSVTDTRDAHRANVDTATKELERIKKEQRRVAEAAIAKPLEEAGSKLESIGEERKVLKLMADDFTLSADRAKFLASGLAETHPILAKMVDDEMKAIEADKARAKEIEESIKKAEELTKSVDDYVKSLEDEVNYQGLSADRIKQKKLEMEGLDKAQKDAIENAIKDKEAMESWNKEADAFFKILEDIKTPMEKYEEQVKKINENPFLTDEQRNKALEKAQESLNKTGKEAKKAREEIQKFDHVLAGSAEARERVQEFREKMARQGFATTSAEPGKPGSPTTTNGTAPTTPAPVNINLSKVEGLLLDIKNALNAKSVAPVTIKGAGLGV